MVRRDEEKVWRVEVEMTGVLATPWPDRRSLSGEEWINPEGDFIQVPYIQSNTTLYGQNRTNYFSFGKASNIMNLKKIAAFLGKQL